MGGLDENQTCLKRQTAIFTPIITPLFRSVKLNAVWLKSDLDPDYKDGFVMIHPTFLSVWFTL